MTESETTQQNLARAKIREIGLLVTLYGHHVDRDVFIAECDRALYLAFPAVRFPVGLWGLGVVALDAACALVDDYLPQAITMPENIGRLPGGAAYLRALGHHVAD